MSAQKEHNVPLLRAKPQAAGLVLSGSGKRTTSMNVFDIIGPVMIGPSSSHTAGAARLGQIARKILGAPAVKAEITLCGSFAQTYRGHGTDKALIAGILGMSPDDERIRTSLQLAEKCGLQYSFKTASLPGAHPNTARITLTDAQGHTSVIQGASVGGGNILVSEINGMRVAVTSQYNTLIVLHHDVPGVIAAITNVMACSGLNIGNFQLSRPQKGGHAVMTIEVDGEVPPALTDSLKVLPNVISVELIEAV